MTGIVTFLVITMLQHLRSPNVQKEFPLFQFSLLVFRHAYLQIDQDSIVSGSVGGGGGRVGVGGAAGPE